MNMANDVTLPRTTIKDAITHFGFRVQKNSKTMDRKIEFDLNTQDINNR